MRQSHYSKNEDSAKEYLNNSEIPRIIHTLFVVLS
jgi:hypothetical protein